MLSVYPNIHPISPPGPKQNPNRHPTPSHVRWVGWDRGGCNEAHPRGAERLYEDLRFWTGIDECESYGVDFLTRKQDIPRGLRPHRPGGESVPQIGSIDGCAI